MAEPVRAPSSLEIAEDEGFEAFIMGAKFRDNPYSIRLGGGVKALEVSGSVKALMEVQTAWERGWNMAARYNGHRA
jgi:hypothetical protein